MEDNFRGMSGEREEEEVSGKKENVGKKYRAAGGRIVTKRRTVLPSEIQQKASTCMVSSGASVMQYVHDRSTTDPLNRHIQKCGVKDNQPKITGLLEMRKLHLVATQEVYKEETLKK
ncbi:hypothetical protein RvY_05391 [Ramazzottius varieornatus]|uniref:Uncharacterized protein n=1 Tax=Ramazzottius varieornatus TaxID=947166 RepID=A0A1D1UUW3_RAMVA|nr:hypothetical protein RvY_05391 [Ramazzottius varieornatus]